MNKPTVKDVPTSQIKPYLLNVVGYKKITDRYDGIYAVNILSSHVFNGLCVDDAVDQLYLKMNHDDKKLVNEKKLNIEWVTEFEQLWETYAIVGFLIGKEDPEEVTEQEVKEKMKELGFVWGGTNKGFVWSPFVH